MPLAQRGRALGNGMRSDLLKIRSTQVWFWMLVLAVVLTALSTITAVLGETEGPNGTVYNPDYYNIFTAAQQATLALLVLGVLGLTTEFRHKTITPTLLATPNRWRMVAAKTLAYVVLAALYSAVCVGVNFLTAIIVLRLRHVAVHFPADLPLGVLRVYLALVLIALFGLGLGGLLRNQAAAMVAGLVYLVIINGLWSGLPYVRRTWPFSPGGGESALMARGHGPDAAADVPHINALAGGLVLAGWVALLLVAATVLLNRRDVS
jgi:hypothetical protein